MKGGGEIPRKRLYARQLLSASNQGRHHHNAPGNARLCLSDVGKVPHGKNFSVDLASFPPTDPEVFNLIVFIAN